MKQTGKWKETGKKLKEELNFEPVFSKKNQSISSPMLSASQELNLSSNMTLGYLILLTTYESWLECTYIVQITRHLGT